MLTRRDLAKGTAATALASLAWGEAPARGAQAPNIVFILADDLGFADLGCFGREDYATPNIDRLANSGTKLLRSYSNSSVCSPTRLALITGRYQYRLPGGLDEPLGRDPRLGLPPDVPTFPDLLKRAGYATSLVGKWHLGGLPEFGPRKSGYDRFWGIYQGGADYFRHGMSIRGKFTHDLWENETEIHRQGYLTDLITEQSFSEIARLASGNRPFLLSVHYTAPHWPWEGIEDEAIAADIRDSFHYDGGSNATYAAMVKSLDLGVGRIMEALRAQNLDGNTILVFTSDNGGERFSKNWPFRGMKGELLEGGIRVPTIFSWPGRVTAGTSTDLINISMDWAPTLLAAAGMEASRSIAFDGRNLLGDLLAGTAGPERTLFWRHFAQQQSAATRGNLKYLAMSGHEFLFDIAADPREVANIRPHREADFDALKAAFADWNRQMLPYPVTTFSYELRDNGHLAGY
ncbi:MAG: sulfatase-like hydrolase/transferase [Sphingomonadales bacterium]|jgi:arylsulfatase A-like enzyme|nr:sulfatase-like hydrolase/transferase [Sphingomonadales bacterium]MBK9002391.1 sulfatase-like hydrolase/transferase [Sphingomonadales bacterium]MBK9267621.1 sulfatase-like hydrolase/transferase [Sphingomonadales bacterium]MBP6434806.1 sulfatase-like hydrolase/transferase [Sphingorhabdus sp.]